jgi:hypothetical protein
MAHMQQTSWVQLMSNAVVGDASLVHEVGDCTSMFRVGFSLSSLEVHIFLKWPIVMSMYM